MILANKQLFLATFAAIFIHATGGTALAQRRDDFDALLARMNAAMQAGRMNEALGAAERLEILVRRQQGADNMNFAGVLHNEGMFLYNLGRPQEAIDKLNVALAIKLRNDDVGSILRTSNILAAALGAIDRRDEAGRVAERALSLGIRAFGPNDVRLVGTMRALGGVARDKGDLSDAASRFEAALSMLRGAGAPPLEIAKAMDDLGDVYGLLGRFDEGERLQRDALGLIEMDRGRAAEAVPDYGRIFSDLGNLLADAGRLPEAEAALRRALEIIRRQAGDSHPNVAATTGNLATVLKSQSRYAEAEKLLLDSLQAEERHFGPSHPQTAVDLNNLANVYLAESRIEAAAGLQERVLAIFEKAFGPGSLEVGRALNNLANSQESRGRRDEAIALLRRSIAILEQRYGLGGRESAIATASIGRMLTDAGEFDEAARYIRQALEGIESTLGPTHLELVTPLHQFALLNLRIGNTAEARRQLDRALQIAQDRLGSRHQDTIAILINLADIDRREEKWGDALLRLRQVEAGLNSGRSLQFPRLPQADPMLIEVIWHMTDGQPHAAALDEVFGAAQLAHESKAGAALAQMSARFGAGSDAMAALVRRQQDMMARLDAMERRLTGELGKADGKRSDVLLGNLRNEMTRMQSSLDNVTAQLETAYPALAELSHPQPLSIVEVQALLKPDEALVAFLVTPQWSWVFAVTREHAALHAIKLGAREIAERVAHLRLGMSSPRDERRTPFDLDGSFAFYDALFGPVAAEIAGKPKLVLVTSGALTSLPFQVLVTQSPSGPATDRYREAAWLINERALMVLPSVTSLRALRVLAKSSRATKPFIGFGDPILQAPAGNRRQARSIQPFNTYYDGAVVDLERLRAGLPALPETATELKAVARALGASPETDVRLRAAATVTSVSRLPLDAYRVVHFATHGLVAGEVSGLSEPALVLSLPDRPSLEDDGLLTSSRITQLRLDADWVVLSACNTAAGDSPGAEGLSGLARAFFYAGARAMLVSHWPVDSDAAVKLTTTAVAELAEHPGIGRAEALRRAMKAVMADRSSAQNADPAFWAPFVLVGEGN